MKKLIIGIDPGVSGGIAVLGPGGYAAAVRMPAEVEIVELLRARRDFPGAGVEACMERLTGFVPRSPGADGKTDKPPPGYTMFKMGRNAGFIEGALMTLGIPVRLVTPRAWQATVAGLKKTKGKARKALLRDEAWRRFPDCKPTLATCDALLIADYWRSRSAALEGAAPKT